MPRVCAIDRGHDNIRQRTKSTGRIPVSGEFSIAKSASGERVRAHRLSGYEHESERKNSHDRVFERERIVKTGRFSERGRTYVH